VSDAKVPGPARSAGVLGCFLWQFVWVVPIAAATLILAVARFGFGASYMAPEFFGLTVLAVLLVVAGYLGMTLITRNHSRRGAWIIPTVVNVYAVVLVAVTALHDSRPDWLQISLAALVVGLLISAGMWLALRRLDRGTLGAGIRITLIALASLGLLLSMSAAVFGLREFQLESDSMQPTVSRGDRVWFVAVRWSGPIRDGNVVVLPDPADRKISLIRRVAATAGQTTPGSESRAVPDGDVWLLSNGSTSTGDSRSFGPQPISSIGGKAVAVIWPLSHCKLFR
jgi:signal peptidase I